MRSVLYSGGRTSRTQAIGEAEAELAYLNTQGFIDAIMTDDVDTLIFGARVVIKK